MTLYIVQPAVQLCHGARRDAVLPVQNQRQRVARQIGQGGVVLAHSQMQYRLAGGKIAKQLAGHLVVIGVAQADKHVGAVFQRSGLVGRQKAGAHKFCTQNTGCLVGIGFKALPAAARHRQCHNVVVQRAEQRQRKAGLPHAGVQAAAENTLYIVVFHRLHDPRQQRWKAQNAYLFPPRGQRCAVGVVGQGLRRDEGPVQRVQQLPLPRKAARGCVVPVGGIGIQLPQKFLPADGGSFQRKRRAVGRADGTDCVKVKFRVQPLNFPLTVHGAAGLLQHQLAERRRRCRGVCSQPGQPQRHRRAALLAVFQRLVHLALVGKGQQVLHGPLRRGGRGVQAVPEGQNMYGMVTAEQLLRQPKAHQGVGAGGVLHPVQYK